MTRHETFKYLLAESLCLAEEADVLRQEFEVLQRGPFTVEAWVAHSLKLRAFRGLLSNHAIAVKWTVRHNAANASALST